MEESGETSREKVKRERDAKRQSAYRTRKKEKGTYVNLFVPREIARKIKGKPGLLVKRFTELSEVMDRLEEQEKEIRELKSKRETRRISRSLEFENGLIERRFGRSDDKELLEQSMGERRRLEESLAEERNEHDRLRRRVHAIIDTAGSLVRAVLDESEDYLGVIHAVNNALLNPRNKNEKRKAMAIDRIRQQCRAVIERGTTAHEDNKAAHDRLFGRWSPHGLRDAVDPIDE